MRDSLSLIFSIRFLNFWTGRSFAMTSIPKLDAAPRGDSWKKIEILARCDLPP